MSTYNGLHTLISSYVGKQGQKSKGICSLSQLDLIIKPLFFSVFFSEKCVDLLLHNSSTGAYHEHITK